MTVQKRRGDKIRQKRVGCSSCKSLSTRILSIIQDLAISDPMLIDCKINASSSVSTFYNRGLVAIVSFFLFAYFPVIFLLFP